MYNNSIEPSIGKLPDMDFKQLISIDNLREGMKFCQIAPKHQECLLASWDRYLPYVEDYFPQYLQSWCNWQWYGSSPTKFFDETNASAFFIIVYCLAYRVSLEVYRRKDISEELWRENMPDVNWHLHELTNGELWLDTITWTVEWHASIQVGQNVKLGRLQFGPMLAKEDYPGLGIKQGDVLVNTHIPAVGRMDIPECLKSFKNAEEFYVPRLGEFKAFFCHSWLLNPIYKKYLPSSSNIVQFQNLGVVFTDNNVTEADVLNRVFYYYHEDPFTATPRSSVQRAVQQMLLKREPMNASIMIRLR